MLAFLVILLKLYKISTQNLQELSTNSSETLRGNLTYNFNFLQ